MERKATTRIALQTALAALLLLFVAACVAAYPATPEPDTSLSGEITFWHSFVQPDRAAAIEDAAARFEEAHPGTHVNVESMTWNDFKKRWRKAAETGGLPDISTACNLYEAEELLHTGLLQPADEVIDAIGRDRFADNVLAELDHGGHVYGVPYYSHAYVMWYRADLLDAADIDVPRTWDDFAAAARALTDPASGVYGYAMALNPDDFVSAINLHMYVRSAGGSLLAPDGSADLTSPEALAGIRYWADLYRDCSPAGAESDGVAEQADRFYRGETAFDFNSGFHVSGVAAARPDLLGSISCTELPTIGPDDASTSAVVTHIPLVLYRDSEHPDVARAFMEFLFEDDNYGAFLDSAPLGMLPSIRGIADTENYQSDPLRRQFAEEEGVIRDAMLHGSALGFENGPNLHAGVLTSSGAIEVMFRDIVLNGKPVEEAARAAEDKLNAQFAEADAQAAEATRAKGAPAPEMPMAAEPAGSGS